MFTPFAFVKQEIAAAPAFEFVLSLTSSFTAFSTSRKLNSTYAGSAYRIRRSNDNAEQDIGFVNNLVDTASLSSFVGANNGSIVTWYDQSGNGVDLTGAGTGGGPYAIQSGVLITSSANIPACSYNFSNQYFERTTAFTSNKVTEIFSLCSIDSNPVPNGLFWCNPDNGYSYGPYETGGAGGSTVASSGARLGQINFAYPTIALVNQFNNVDGGANNSFLYHNGTQNNYTTITGTWVAASFNKINLGRGPFGATFYVQGRMSEWIMFQDTGGQRTNVRNNINTFYGL